MLEIDRDKTSERYFSVDKEQSPERRQRPSPLSCARFLAADPAGRDHAGGIGTTFTNRNLSSNLPWL